MKKRIMKLFELRTYLFNKTIMGTKEKMLDEAKKIYEETWILVKWVSSFNIKTWLEIKISFKEIQDFIY